MTAPTLLPEKERVWILEMNTNPLKGEKKTTDKGKTFKFKGLCAEFNDDLNENNRAYDKSNYDSKAEELYEKIKKRALLGELDHNEDFLVSMKNASHIVTGLDDKGESYEIEIELIPGTVQGDNAIALAEAGVPLFISSRASGYIDRAGNVTLEKIYTYDLVSEPGFKNAELVQVNESLRPDGKLRKVQNKIIKIYKYKEPEHKGNTGKSIKEINKQNTDTMAYATKSELLELKKEVAKLKSNGIRFINESLQIPNKLKFNGIPVEMLSKIPKANDVLTVDSVDFTVKKVENIDESVDSSPNFKLRGTYAYTLGLEGLDGATKVGYITKTGEFHLADDSVSPLAVKEASTAANFDAATKKVWDAVEAKINDIIDAVNSSKMEQKLVTKYTDGLAKILEHAINEHDKMVKFVNLMADHADQSSLVINKIIEGSDAQAKRLNLVTESLDVTQQFVNEHAAYSDAQAKVLNKLIEHSDKATKHLNMLHHHSDQLTTVVNVHESKISKGTILKPTAPLRKLGAPASKTPVASAIAKKEGILDVTKKILATVKSTKTEELRSVLESKYPFTKDFSEEELTKFKALPENKRQFVLAKMGSKARKANVLEAITFASKQVNGLEFLELMPEDKKDDWSKLTTARKQNIIALFQSKNLRSKAATEAFWDNIDLKPVKTVGLVRKINESVEKPILEKSAMGYSETDMAEALGL